MNKTELIAAVAEEAKMTKKDAEKAVKAVLDVISESLEQGDKVALIGFGTFEVRQRAARTGHNPSNQETIQIPASKAPAFRPSKQLKERVHHEFFTGHSGNPYMAHFRLWQKMSSKQLSKSFNAVIP